MGALGLEAPGGWCSPGLGFSVLSLQWQVQFDCYPVESGRRVLVSLGTVPDRGLSLNQTLLVATEPAGKGRGPSWERQGLQAGRALPGAGHEPRWVLGGCRALGRALHMPTPCPRSPGPTFSYEWLPAARAIAVSVPEGPALMVRLCHQLTLECEELHRPFHQQVMPPLPSTCQAGASGQAGSGTAALMLLPSSPQVLVHGGHRAVLPYEFLLPCLCIEVCALPGRGQAQALPPRGELGRKEGGCQDWGWYGYGEAREPEGRFGGQLRGGLCPWGGAQPGLPTPGPAMAGDGAQGPALWLWGEGPWWHLTSLLPQASWLHRDGLRTKRCPFQDHPAACECPGATGVALLGAIGGSGPDDRGASL